MVGSEHHTPRRNVKFLWNNFAEPLFSTLFFSSALIAIVGTGTIDIGTASTPVLVLYFGAIGMFVLGIGGLTYYFAAGGEEDSD